MSDKPQHPRAAALAVARELTRMLTPFCSRILVAGSLRRGKDPVGDVEILYLPRFLDWPDPADMFGRLIPTNVPDHVLSLLLESGWLAKRLNKDGVTSWGTTNKLALHCGSGIPVDFFRVPGAEAWPCNVVCRTGGAQSNLAIASAARARGYTWHSTGSGFERIDGPDKGKLHLVYNEREVFEFVGMPYVEPEARR